MEAEAAKPRVTASQHLLATYYKLAGRVPPVGVRLPDPSVAAPAIEKAKAAAAKAAAAASAAGSGSDLARRVAGAKPPRKPPPGYGSGAAAGGFGGFPGGISGGGGGGGGAAGGSMTPTCGIVVGPFRGVDMKRPEAGAPIHTRHSYQPRLACCYVSPHPTTITTTVATTCV